MQEYSNYIIPNWPAPKSVRALCTTRGHNKTCGDSAFPFNYFNQSNYVGDNINSVKENNNKLNQILSPASAIFLKQVHGVDIIELTKENIISAENSKYDAAITQEKNIACTIQTADCLPVLFAAITPENTVKSVAAAHAGWRGLAAGILQATVEKIYLKSDTNIIAWIGPAIGKNAFEVGEDVLQEFIKSNKWTDKEIKENFKEKDGAKYNCDLAKLAKLQLLKNNYISGVYGNDSTEKWCTFANENKYYSYRRDNIKNGATGRIASCIAII